MFASQRGDVRAKPVSARCAVQGTFAPPAPFPPPAPLSQLFEPALSTQWAGPHPQVEDSLLKRRTRTYTRQYRPAYSVSSYGTAPPPLSLAPTDLCALA